MQAYLSTLNTALAAIARIPTYVPVIMLLAPIVLFVRIPVLTPVLILPYRFLVWIARGFGVSHKKHTWSVVYDSKTKLPLDPAYVTVRNTLGVEVASMITDINGRFSLILPRGIYTIDVQKTNYAFPSYEMRGATKDGAYTNLYYGQKIDVVDTERSVAVAIPMDQMGDDWNEQEKKRMNIQTHFGRQQYVTGAEYLYLIAGTLLSGIHYIVYRDMFSMNITFAFFALIVLRLFWYLVQPAEYAHSVVIEAATGKPLAFAKVSVYSAETKNKILTKTTSFEGQFTALLPKGTYYLSFEGRDAAGNYSLLHTTTPFTLASGYLGKKFSV